MYPVQFQTWFTIYLPLRSGRWRDSDVAKIRQGHVSFAVSGPRHPVGLLIANIEEGGLLDSVETECRR